MIPGFNHNIKHKGRVFHIQTEDSGQKNPHIITHLFVGGNIIASKKTTYAEIVGQPNFQITVRSMMEEQHKAMLRNLIHGAYDDADVENAYHLDGPAPLNTDPKIVSPATNVMAGQAAHNNRPSTKPAPGGVAATTPPPTPPVVKLPPASADAAKTLVPTPAMAAAQEKGGGSIFGEDLISEKSLDEVILSYLAEDLADLD